MHNAIPLNLYKSKCRHLHISANLEGQNMPFKTTPFIPEVTLHHDLTLRQCLADHPLPFIGESGDVADIEVL